MASYLIDHAVIADAKFPQLGKRLAQLRAVPGRFRRESFVDCANDASAEVGRQFPEILRDHFGMEFDLVGQGALFNSEAPLDLSEGERPSAASPPPLGDRLKARVFDDLEGLKKQVPGFL